jgi:hypothetical protein
MGNSLSLTHPERENSFASNRKLWLSVGPLIVLLLFLGMYGCTRALRSGSHEAYLLAEGLHASMTKQDWKGIYENADDNFNQVITEEKSTELFSGIVRKLGPRSPANRGVLRLLRIPQETQSCRNAKRLFRLMQLEPTPLHGINLAESIGFRDITSRLRLC